MSETHDPEVLGAAADHIRWLYVCARRQFNKAQGKPTSYGADVIPQWDGGQDSMGRTFKPIWPKIAKFFRAHDLDPAECVTAAFAAAKHGTPPNPTALCDTKLIGIKDAMYELLRERLYAQRVSCEQQLAVLVSRAKAYLHFDEPEAVKHVLTAESSQFDALFRYCAGVRMGLQPTVERYHEAALARYFWVPRLFDEVWGDWIPESLRQEAQTVRAVI